MNIYEHPACSKNLSVLHKSIHFFLLLVTHLVPNLVNYNLIRGFMITERYSINNWMCVCMFVCYGFYASLIARIWPFLCVLGLVNFRCAAVVNRSVSFQRCTTLDLIHQRFVTYPRVRQCFTVDQASHSEGLPRESLLGESRVQILQEADAGFSEHVVASAAASSTSVTGVVGVSGRTATTGAHLVIVSLTIGLRLLVMLLMLLGCWCRCRIHSV